MSAIEEIIHNAREVGASDVHLAAGLSPRMRIGGALISMNCSGMTAADTLDILISMMPETLRGRFEEQGECVFSVTMSDGGRCRVNAYRQKGSVALALRLIGAEAPQPEELGIPEPFIGLCGKKSGLALVAGSSGSGRTTTLASMTARMNDSTENLIITLENPLEYLHGHGRSIVSQREIGRDSRGYAEGIRAAVREDADVIIIGELCDGESVCAAVRAAEMGCLVFASLDAAGMADLAESVMDLCLPDQRERLRVRLANVLEAALFQRLCPADDGDGLKAVFELLLPDENVRRHIREGRFSALSGAVRSWGKE